MKAYVATGENSGVIFGFWTLLFFAPFIPFYLMIKAFVFAVRVVRM